MPILILITSKSLRNVILRKNRLYVYKENKSLVVRRVLCVLRLLRHISPQSFKNHGAPLSDEGSRWQAFVKRKFFVDGPHVICNSCEVNAAYRRFQRSCVWVSRPWKWISRDEAETCSWQDGTNRSGDRSRKKKKQKKKKTTRWMGDENYHRLRKKTAGQNPDLVNPGPNYLFFANPRFNSHRTDRVARYVTPPSDLCAVRIARIIAMINYVIRTFATCPTSRYVTFDSKLRIM